MHEIEYIISKKYALAFLNLHFDDIDNVVIDNILRVISFLKRNKTFYISLRIPSISNTVKQDALVKMADSFKLSQGLKRVFLLLLQDKRIEILDKVLFEIIVCYREKKDIKLFKVSTSHKLDDAEKDRILSFVEHVAKSEVLTKFIVDEKLICGFRIQSKNFLWERSMAKQLRDVKRSIFKQVGLW